jgi:hypothetical protein
LAVRRLYKRRTKPHGVEWQALVRAAGYSPTRQLAMRRQPTGSTRPPVSSTTDIPRRAGSVGRMRERPVGSVAGEPRQPREFTWCGVQGGAARLRKVFTSVLSYRTLVRPRREILTQN